MKLKFLIFILTVCSSQISCGQNEKLEITKSDNSRLIKVLNNSEQIGENRDDNLSVRIYIIDNGSGSAGLAEGHEVSHNLLIAASEFDENPKQSLFEISQFINPKFMNWNEIKESEKEFEIEHGVYDKRKTIKFNVTINDLKIKK